MAQGLDNSSIVVEVLDNVPVKLNPEKTCDQLHARGEDERTRVQTMVEDARRLIQARAAYRVCYIDEKLEKTIVIEGVRLTSGVLRKNVEEVWRVFPYLVTIGNSLDPVAAGCNDLVEKYWIDFIGNIALNSAQEFLKNHVRNQYALDSMSCMNPGSLEDWPIQEQKPLFALLGDAGLKVGVTLTEDLVMRPTKSLSGLFFPTDTPFYSCQLCSREKCVGRRAKYDEQLAFQYKIRK